MTVGRDGVAAALRLSMPRPEHAGILRAALGDGEAGRRAFAAWAGATGDPRRLDARATRALKELGPLLAHVRRREHLEVEERPLATLLRAAEHREALRWASYLAAADEAVGALAAAGLAPVVTGGAGVAVSAYPEHRARHCHDLDLVLGSVPEGMHVLEAAGPRPPDPVPEGDAGGVLVVHRSGLRLRLHDAGLPGPWSEVLSATRLRDAGRVARPGEVDWLVPRAEDLLLLVCVHAVAGRPRHSVRWVADAALLGRAVDLDRWDEVAGRATAAGLGPVLEVVLGYLGGDLELGGPAAPAGGARPTDGREEQMVAWAVRSRERRPGRADRQAVVTGVRWALWPSAAYLSLGGRRRSRARRLTSWAAGRARRVARRARVLAGR